MRVAEQTAGEGGFPGFRRHFGKRTSLGGGFTIPQVIRKRPFEQVAGWVVSMPLAVAAGEEGIGLAAGFEQISAAIGIILPISAILRKKFHG